MTNWQRGWMFATQMDPSLKWGARRMPGLGCGVNQGEKKRWLPLLSDKKQSIDKAELHKILTAVENKTPGVPLHVVTDSETVLLD